MKKRIQRSLALALSAALLLTGCSASSTRRAAKLISNASKQVTENSADPTAAPTPEPTPATTQLKLGDKATIGDWTFTAKKITIKKQIKTSNYLGYKPDKGNQFICVSMAVKNNGSEEADFLPGFGYEDKMNTAVIYYQNKYEYKPSVLTSYKKDLADEKIKPLNKKSGVVVFEVPKKVAKNLGETTLKIGTTQENVVYSLK
ncbi:MAG: DUF4352 domain-containing protein [Eubacteriales bacterium]|nr:DUF4352 domain-containing protein [Eubacteriales bacterium]